MRAGSSRRRCSPRPVSASTPSTSLGGNALVNAPIATRSPSRCGAGGLTCPARGTTPPPHPPPTHAGRKPAMKDTQKSAKSTTAIDKKFEGFTDEERGAMKERAQELKAAARRGPRADKADAESAVLAKIAEMPEPDRAMGERLHAIIKA